MADPGLGTVFLAIKKIQEETPDMAWMLDYPEPAKLLIKLASDEISEEKFWSDMYKTKFWKETNDAQRQWRSLVEVDPAKATRQRQDLTARVRQLMGEMGINLQGAKVRAKGEHKDRGYDLRGASTAAKIADLALYNGWSDTRLTNYLLSLATWRQEGQGPTGGIAVAMNQMRRLEEEYGVQTRERNRFRSAKRILGGTETVEAYEERLRNRALAKYGENAEIEGVLKRGGTLEDWFGDYRRMIAEELEVPEAEISVNSPRWQEILNSKAEGPDGRVRPMTMEEARRHIRTRSEWNDTTKAKEMEAGMGQNLLEVFGKRAA